LGHTMRTLKFLSAAPLLFALATGAAGEDFKPYPGAAKYTPPDTEVSRKWKEALPAGTTISAYITRDSFDKVVSYYKNSAKQYTSPRTHGGGKLPNGQEMQQAFFIFDGASDLSTSRRWARVQHPFVGSVSVKGKPQFTDIRDATEIVLTEKKATPKTTK
jgi:hypothetical protein